MNSLGVPAPLRRQGAVITSEPRGFQEEGHEQISCQRLRNARRHSAVGACRHVAAEARIECRGQFQVSKYGLISTPYCEEEQIARVARSYGVNVTGAQVRNDALKKVYLCQTLGNDIRMKGSCGGYAPEVYGH